MRHGRNDVKARDVRLCVPPRTAGGDGHAAAAAIAYVRLHEAGAEYILAADAAASRRRLGVNHRRPRRVEPLAVRRRRPEACPGQCSDGTAGTRASSHDGGESALATMLAATR